MTDTLVERVKQIAADPRYDIMPSIRAILNEMALANEAQDSRIAELEGALERLGSTEAMTSSFMRRDNEEGRELDARVTFARKALGDKTLSNGGQEPLLDPGTNK